MKVNINNKELDIYDTDDNSITKLSIAKSLNTLPKYLFFKNPYSNTSENNEIVDILNILQEGEIKDKYIQTIKDFIKNRRKYDISVNTIEEIDIIRDILFVILCYNKELSDIINTSDNIDTLLFSFREDQYKYIIQMMMQIDDSLDRKKLESEKFFKDFLIDFLLVLRIDLRGDLFIREFLLFLKGLRFLLPFIICFLLLCFIRSSLSISLNVNGVLLLTLTVGLYTGYEFFVLLGFTSIHFSLNHLLNFLSFPSSINLPPLLLYSLTT